MSKKKLQVEILPALRTPPSVPASVGMALEKLVEFKIAEVRSRQDMSLFEPWFRTRSEANELKRLQKVPEQRKWAIFYKRYGCLRCKTKKRVHAGTGFCMVCRSWVHRELSKIVKELLKQAGG